MRKIRLTPIVVLLVSRWSLGAPLPTASTAPATAPTPGASISESSSTEKPRLGDDEKNVVAPVEPPPKVIPAKITTKPTLGDIADPAKDKREKKDPSIADGVTPEDRKKLLDDVSQEFYEKGEIAIQQGRLQEARDLFERVLTLQPGHVLARARLTSIMRTLDPPEPETAAPPKNSKDALVAKLTIDLDRWIKNKSWDKADHVAKNILAVDPNNEKTKTKLKSIHRQLALRAADRAAAREKAGDFQGAVDAYRVAINYYKDQAYTEKIEELSEKIAETNDKRSEELYLQALDSSQNGNAAKAMELCREALQLNPDNIQAERMLDRLQSKPNP